MTVVASRILDFTQGSETDGDTLKITVSPSPLDVGDSIQISMFSQFDYELMSPYQNASVAATYGQQEFEEDIDVNQSSEVSTNYPVANLISAVHLTPLVDTENRTIIAPAGQTASVDIVNSTVVLDGDERVGTIRLNYKTYEAQSYDLTSFSNAGIYVVFYKKVTDTEWKAFTFNVGEGQADERSQPSIVTVQAKDFCTDLPIEGATVYVDGSLIGVTDVNGKRVVGLMAAGAHSLKIQATNYIPTDSDDLSNDSFQI